MCRCSESSALAENQIKISKIHEQADALTEYENRIALVDRVRKQHDPTANAEVPESDRNHASPLALALPPLDQKAREEHGLTKQPHHQPDMVKRHPRKSECQHC